MTVKITRACVASGCDCFIGDLYSGEDAKELVRLGKAVVFHEEQLISAGNVDDAVCENKEIIADIMESGPPPVSKKKRGHPSKKGNK